jgi:hypothetical protein
MMEKSLPCDACRDLDTYHLIITADSLSKSATGGCEACSVLDQGLSHFLDHFEADTSLELLVDYSLFVFAKIKYHETLSTVEFYTHIGRRETRSFSTFPNLILNLADQTPCFRSPCFRSPCFRSPCFRSPCFRSPYFRSPCYLAKHWTWP